jgi:hypothetical protein
MNITSAAIPALLILVDPLCFDRYKIDYSGNTPVAFIPRSLLASKLKITDGGCRA